MRKYQFEASRNQWEKPTEPQYVFVTTAKTIVYAETEEAAKQLAQEKLTKEYYGTGTLLGDLHCIGQWDLPVDWCYGYGDARQPGTPKAMEELVAQSVIR